MIPRVAHGQIGHTRVHNGHTRGHALVICTDQAYRIYMDNNLESVYAFPGVKASLDALDALRSESDEDTLRRLGFEPRYYLCRHPGWPDPLNIWPPTAENAQRVYDEHPHPDAYVLMKWEKGPRSIVHAPRSTEQEPGGPR